MSSLGRPKAQRRQRRDEPTKATKNMDAARGGEAMAGGGHARTMLRLGALFGLWHLFTVVYNKQVSEVTDSSDI